MFKEELGMNISVDKNHQSENITDCSRTQMCKERKTGKIEARMCAAEAVGGQVRIIHFRKALNGPSS